MHSVELVFASRLGCILDLLARGGLFHEEGAHPLVPGLAYQSGGRRLGDSLGSFGRIPKERHQLRSVACWPRTFLFALGLGSAIWARLNIGRNWGAPMSQKDEPELVTSGPYRLVRHPIYSGIVLAVLGTAIVLSWLFLAALVLAGVYFTYSARVEKRYLTEQVPDTYPVYRRSTKMLVPFIF